MQRIEAPHHTLSQKMLTTADLAARLNFSQDTAPRVTPKTPGVLRLGAGLRQLYEMPEPTFNACVARKSFNVKKGGRQ